jgi:hypothetical protein
VQALLDAGFPVRGSVRSADKGEYLKERFRGKSASFDYVIVDDIEKVCSWWIAMYVARAELPAKRL